MMWISPTSLIRVLGVMALLKPLALSEDNVDKRSRFIEARDEMVKIYHSLHQAIDGVMGRTEDKMILKELKVKVDSIKEIIDRSKMKVAVFGRTSSGKSTLINALLGEKVLPSSCGETTAGFSIIEGTDKNNAHAEMSMNGIRSQLSIKEFKKRSNMLDMGKMHWDELYLYWPKSKCGLLSNDVVIVDCPGTSTAKSTEEQVYKFYRDADLYIFVVNAIASIDKDARNFFKNVTELISKPEILMVFTFWDIAQSQTDDEEEQIRVMKQHTDRATSLLKDDLDLKIKAKDRIFFVSPFEILEPDIERKKPKWEERQENFDHMEKVLKHKLSVSAVQTKFQNHCEEGAKIAQTIEAQINNVLDQLERRRKTSQDQIQENQNNLQKIAGQQKRFLEECQTSVEKARKQIKLRRDIFFYTIYKDFSENVVKDKPPREYLKDIEEQKKRRKISAEKEIDDIFTEFTGKHETKINKLFTQIMPAEMTADGSPGTFLESDSTFDMADTKLDDWSVSVCEKAQTVRNAAGAIGVGGGAAWALFAVLPGAAPIIAGVGAAVGAGSHFVKENYCSTANTKTLNSAVSDAKKWIKKTVEQKVENFNRSHDKYMQTFDEKCQDYKNKLDQDIKAAEEEIQKIDSSISEMKQQKTSLDKKTREDLRHFKDKFIDVLH